MPAIETAPGKVTAATLYGGFLICQVPGYELYINISTLQD